MNFKEWWKTGVHGWNPKEELSEYVLAREAWDKCKEEVLKILKSKEGFIGSGIKSAIKEVEEL